MEHLAQSEEVKESRKSYFAHIIPPYTHKICRWLKLWGVQIESERNLRQTSTRLVSTEVLCEAVPFSFPMKRGGEELRPAPLAYIPHLVSKVEELLDQNERSCAIY